MKMIPVRSCLWCPYHQQDKEVIYCMHPEILKDTKDVESLDISASSCVEDNKNRRPVTTITAYLKYIVDIPKWCPLENYD